MWRSFSSRTVHSIGTTITLVTIAQTQVVGFSAAQNALIVQRGSAVVGVFGAWNCLKRLCLDSSNRLQCFSTAITLVRLYLEGNRVSMIQMLL